MALRQSTVTEQPDRFDEAIEALASSLRGRLLRPGGDGYGDATVIWNGRYQRRSPIVVQSADAQDVALAVRFAREHDLPIAIRSGGHSMIGYSSTENGVLVDLSHMKSLTIDPEAQVAHAGAGLTWSEYAQAAAAHGLATSSGDMGSVGLGGLTLGGGIGWMVRKHGLTLDHLISIEVVTADGTIRRASRDENADLFWAMRGGGGNFGIATGFELRLQKAPLVVGGAVFYPISDLKGIKRAYVDYASAAPDELTTMAMVMSAPPAPFIPQERQGELSIVIMVCYSGDIEEGMRVVEPLRRLGTPIADVVSPMPYPVMFELTKEGTIKEHRHDIRNMFMTKVTDDLIDTVDTFMKSAHTPLAMVQLRVLGGAMARVPEDDTAFAHRDKPYMFNIIASWVDPADDEKNREWTASFWQATRQYAAGVYSNFLENEGEARIRDAYKPATYRRLVELKNKYDPTNLFHLNQNIRPTV